MVKNLKFWQFCLLYKIADFKFLENEILQMAIWIHEQSIHIVTEEDIL